jgi:uncharacterized membrane protein YvbJ
MIESRRFLVVDLGNTDLKFGYFFGDNLEHTGRGLDALKQLVMDTNIDKMIKLVKNTRENLGLSDQPVSDTINYLLLHYDIFSREDLNTLETYQQVIIEEIDKGEKDG